MKVIQKTLRSTRLSYSAGRLSRVPKVMPLFGTTEVVPSRLSLPVCCTLPSVVRFPLLFTSVCC